MLTPEQLETILPLVQETLLFRPANFDPARNREVFLDYLRMIATYESQRLKAALTDVKTQQTTALGNADAVAAVTKDTLTQAVAATDDLLTALTVATP